MNTMASLAASLRPVAAWQANSRCPTDHSAWAPSTSQPAPVHARLVVRVSCSQNRRDGGGGSSVRRAAAGGRRRDVLAATAAALALLGSQRRAAAVGGLPRGYEDTALKLVKALQESITTDLTGAEEREVRRAADPAKDLVRQFLTSWRGSEAVLEEQESYRQITAAIQQLGLFYQRNGQRTRMSDEVGYDILRKLAAAEDVLPKREEKRSLLPF